jgi:hypothetical protein
MILPAFHLLNVPPLSPKKKAVSKKQDEGKSVKKADEGPGKSGEGDLRLFII